jgi:hypothetical protein
MSATAATSVYLFIGPPVWKNIDTLEIPAVVERFELREGYINEISRWFRC